MEVKKLKHILKRHQKLYDAGVKAIEQRNFKYAIEMFRNLLKEEPGILELREKLRDIELESIGREASPMRQALAPLMKLPNMIKGPQLISQGKYSEALDNAEAAMAFDPTAIACCTLLAKAADAANLPAITIKTLETALEFHPDNVSLLEWLARSYSTIGKGKEAIECREKIVRVDKQNQKRKEELANTISIASEDDRDPEEISQKPAEESDPKKSKKTKSEREEFEKLANDKKALETQIRVTNKNVEQNETPEGRKRLGDLYALAKEHDRALENYNRSVELASVMDVSIDYAITQVEAQKLSDAISQWVSYLADESLSAEEKENARNQIEAYKQAKADMLIERAQDRVQRHSQRVDYRLELAKLLWRYGRFDLAINEFEQTKNNKEYKVISMLFLGKCFYGKGQFEQGINSLKSAIEMMERMNKAQKDAWYTLAKCYEGSNNEEEAGTCYNTIYAVDENYKDVSDIVDKIFHKRQLSDY